ncbi:MAG: hypothetical protein JWN94_981 [Betaproteobacteria bacterium]|nr:hypothetical protein [Betaproteobacteria bacterium]
MNKRQRFEAAVNGDDIDHPPSVVWVHFVTDALPAGEAARRHAEYVRTMTGTCAKSCTITGIRCRPDSKR